MTFDPADPATIADPFGVFRDLQARDPVHYSEPLGGFMLTRYDDVLAALRDPRLSSDRISPFMERLPPEQRESMAELWAALRLWTVFSDPPAHTRMRALFNKAFTPIAASKMHRRIEDIVDELLVPLLTQTGEIDLIERFAYPLPAMVICEMLGVPADAIDDIRAWSDDVATFVGLAKKPFDTYLAAHRSNRAMTEFFREAVAQRRSSPRDDILSSLIAAQEGDDRLSDEEIVATAILLLFAAHTTTTHLIGNGMLALLRNPAQLALLRADPSLIDGAVEELLRYDGPIQAVRRIAKESLVIGGVDIERGAIVFCMVSAANRDPRRFPDPDTLDIRRADSRHIGFGIGPHVCAGAPLARLEARIAFRALTAARTLEPVPDAALQWLASFGFRGLKALPLRVRDVRD